MPLICTIKSQRPLGIPMSEPKFKLIPLKNYRHTYQVKDISYMETEDPRFTYAIISLKPTDKNIKDTQYFTVVKKPLNTSGNNDVEVVFSEEISNVIKKHVLVS